MGQKSLYRIYKTMMTKDPTWGCSSFFYIPNEDASIICEAILCLDKAPNNPLFVGGSGMVLLEAMNTLPNSSSAVYVDISSNQVEYFRSLLSGIEKCCTSREFQDWFVNGVYPKLRDHYIRYKSQMYQHGQVLSALENLFRISFLFSDMEFQKVKDTINRIKICRSDIITYLNENRRYDFVYLSNVADYMEPKYCEEMFHDCARNCVPVYLLMTDACNQKGLIKKAWEKAGYHVHQNSRLLSEQNRGLGSWNLKKEWNRRGDVYLLNL